MSEPPVHTSVDEVQAHAHKTGHGWVDMAIALSAITISVISLFVAIAHGKTEEKLVAASSWPFLLFQSSDNGFGTNFHALNFRLQNSGVGPARVRSLRVLLDGRAVPNHFELLARCCGVTAPTLQDEFQLGLVSQNDVVGVIPARDGINFLTWRLLQGHAAIFDSLGKTRHKLSFDACYCSVLDECWTSDLTPAGNPRRVGQCPIVKDGYEM